MFHVIVRPSKVAALFAMELKGYFVKLVCVDVSQGFAYANKNLLKGPDLLVFSFKLVTADWKVRIISVGSQNSSASAVHRPRHLRCWFLMGDLQQPAHEIVVIV